MLPRPYTLKTGDAIDLNDIRRIGPAVRESSRDYEQEGGGSNWVLTASYRVIYRDGKQDNVFDSVVVEYGPGEKPDLGIHEENLLARLEEDRTFLVNAWGNPKHQGA